MSPREKELEKRLREVEEILDSHTTKTIYWFDRRLHDWYLKKFGAYEPIEKPKDERE